MRLAFLGTPSVAVASFDAVHASRHEIVAVVTRPDAPAGRKRELRAPELKVRASELGYEVWQPEKARDVIDDIVARDVDAICVVAYGGWLPKVVLDATAHGCINVHPSLLPRWRGAAPVERAIMASDPVTGVSTMRLDEGLDTGPVLLQTETPIGAEETSGELLVRLAAVGGDLLVATLDGLEDGTVKPVLQTDDGVTYAEKLTPEECRVDFAAPAAQVDALIRGANPRPGAWCELDGRRLKLWRSRRVDGTADAAPGTCVRCDPEPVVACGDGGLVQLRAVQPDGKAQMPAEAFARGHDLVGCCLT